MRTNFQLVTVSQSPSIESAIRYNPLRRRLAFRTRSRRPRPYVSAISDVSRSRSASDIARILASFSSAIPLRHLSSSVAPLGKAGEEERVGELSSSTLEFVCCTTGGVFSFGCFSLLRAASRPRAKALFERCCAAGKPVVGSNLPCGGSVGVVVVADDLRSLISPMREDMHAVAVEWSLTTRT